MTGAALSIKLQAYAHFVRSREWDREQRPMPGLLVVTFDLSQEQREQRIVRMCAEAGLMIRTTPAVYCKQEPLVPIWSTGMG